MSKERLSLVYGAGTPAGSKVHAGSKRLGFSSCRPLAAIDRLRATVNYLPARRACSKRGADPKPALHQAKEVAQVPGTILTPGSVPREIFSGGQAFDRATALESEPPCGPDLR